MPSPKLSNQLINKVCAAVRCGAPIEAAALSAGVTQSILSGWLSRGRELLEYQSKHGAYPAQSTSRDWMCAKLAEEADIAFAEVILKYSKSINNAVAKGNWGAAAWWLDRRAKRHFDPSSSKTQEAAENKPRVLVYVPDNGRGPQCQK